MTARRVIAEARAARTTSVAAQQVRRDPALIQKEVLADVSERLHARPVAPRRRDVRPTLFGGVYGFF